VNFLADVMAGVMITVADIAESMLAIGNHVGQLD